MSKFEKSMEEIFDVVPKEVPETKELLPAEKQSFPIEQKSAPTVSEFDKQLDKDYEETRSHLDDGVDCCWLCFTNASNSSDICSYWNLWKLFLPDAFR